MALRRTPFCSASFSILGRLATGDWRLATGPVLSVKDAKPAGHIMLMKKYWFRHVVCTVVSAPTDLGLKSKKYV